MDPRKCVACGHCENACSFRRSQTIRGRGRTTVSR
ncbi:MAG: hypothetical protein GY815_02210 [Gammaproteobacteria bacterium]|nr:hypothetical protein [Gammaproteobacteria bacterium]